jgi:hypothetical protein
MADWLHVYDCCHTVSVVGFTAWAPSAEAKIILTAEQYFIMKSLTGEGGFCKQFFMTMPIHGLEYETFVFSVVKRKLVIFCQLWRAFKMQESCVCCLKISWKPSSMLPPK